MTSISSPVTPSNTDTSGDGSFRPRKEKLASGLYVVATPIGNLRDITLRALDILASVDIVLAEDTRHTGKLLQAHGLKAQLRPYHDHNGARARPGILGDLAAGKSLALVSDAGTPLISDPGYKLVSDVADAGHIVTAIPGASALTAALSIAGIATDRFLFAGFLPSRPVARRAVLDDLAGVKSSLAFYETGPRLPDMLAAAGEVLGDRPACIARELTKLHEDARRGKLVELAGSYAGAPPPKGEIVVLIGPPAEDADKPDGAALDRLIGVALSAGESVSGLSARLAKTHGLVKREVYSRALALKSDRADGQT